MTETTNLTRSAIAGVAWNYAGAGVLVVTQIASTSITARLVSPREFGAYATAQAAAGLLGYFTFTAIAQGILRRPSLRAKTIGTATSLSLAAAAAASSALWLLAGVFADAWHVPTATHIIHVLALTLFFNSVAMVPLALARRRLRFRAAAIAETATQVAGAAVGVALAFKLHSAFALALGQTAAAALLLATAWLLVFRELRLAFDRVEARELLAFSTQVTLLNFSSYIMSTAPRWFAARSFGAAALGVVSRANLIVGLPQNYLTFGVMKVVYPLYGRMRDDESRVKVLVAETITLSTAFVWPLFALVAGAAPVVVSLLLGPGWSGASPLVALFALVALAELPCGLLTNAGEAFGWMRTMWGRQLTFLAMLAAAFVTVHVAGLGLEALVAGVAIAQWISYGFTITAFVRRGFLDLRTVFVTHLSHGALALAAFAAASLTARGLHGAPLVFQAAAEIAVAFGFALAIFQARRRFPGGRVLSKRLGEIGLGTLPRPRAVLSRVTTS